MSVPKKEVMLLVLAIAVSLTILVGMFYYSLPGNNLTGAAIGLEVENESSTAEFADANVFNNSVTNTLNQTIDLELGDNSNNTQFSDDESPLTSAIVLDQENTSESGPTTIKTSEVGIQAACGTTIVSDTTQTAPVSGAGTCITIGASGITLDCDNWEIGYGSAGTGFGVDNADGYDDITIKNCKIINQDTSPSEAGNYGIYFGEGALRGLIMDNTIITNGSDENYGIFLTNGTNQTRILRNTIAATGTGGNNYGILISNQSTNNTVADITIRTGETAGIPTDNNQGIRIAALSHNNTIENNTITTISNSGGIGISIIASSGNYIRTNNISTTDGPTPSNNVGINLRDDNGISSQNNILLNNNISSSPHFPIRDDTSLSVINFLIYNNSWGEINWQNNNSVEGFLQNLTFNVSTSKGLGLDRTIFITNNSIVVNTSAFVPSKINSSANLTLKGIDHQVYFIKKLSNITSNGTFVRLDGETCTECNITSFSNGVLKFNTSKLPELAGDSCGLLTTNKTLSSDISSERNCITIGANGITLDCANNVVGFGFDSQPSPTNRGIDNQGYDFVTVKNCRISQQGTSGSFEQGIRFTGGILNSFILNNTIITNMSFGSGGIGSYGVLLNSTNNSWVLGNIIATTSDGDENYGVLVSYSSNNNTIGGNTIFTAQGAGCSYNDGIKMTNQSHNNTAENNTITLGGTEFNSGISIKGSSENVIRNNNISYVETSCSIFAGITGIQDGILIEDLSPLLGIVESVNNLLINNNLSTRTAFIRDNTAKTTTNINYLIYNNSFGEIKWIDNLTTEGFLQNLTINITNDKGFGLDKNIFIRENLAAINHSAFSEKRFNSTTHITFFNPGFTAEFIKKTDTYSIDITTFNGSVVRDTGSVCSTCTILSVSNELVKFNLSGFSGYSADFTPAPSGGVSAPTAASSSSSSTATATETPPAEAPPTTEAPPIELPPAPVEALPPEETEMFSPITEVVAATVSLSNPTGGTVRLKPKIKELEVINITLENEPAIKEKIMAMMALEESLCGNDLEQNLEVLKLLQREKVQPVYQKKYNEIFDKSAGILLNKQGRGLFVKTMSGIIYGDSFICANLLRSELLDQDEIVLEPGEKIEKKLKIRPGITSDPHKVQIVFTEAGRNFAQQTVELPESLVTGTAIDADLPGNIFDFYLLILADQLPKDKTETYLLEFTINKKAQGLRKLWQWLYQSEVMYSELYGPYHINGGNNVLFAQQLKYDPEQYHGNYIIKTKVYQKDIVISEDEFDVVLGMR